MRISWLLVERWQGQVRKAAWSSRFPHSGLITMRCILLLMFLCLGLSFSFHLSNPFCSLLRTIVCFRFSLEKKIFRSKEFLKIVPTYFKKGFLWKRSYSKASGRVKHSYPKIIPKYLQKMKMMPFGSKKRKTEMFLCFLQVQL